MPAHADDAGAPPPVWGPGRDPGSPSPTAWCAAVLRAGGVVAVPTDTVYGLAADPSVPGATERLFVLKGRPAELDLPVLVAGPAQAAALVAGGRLSAAAGVLAEAFWPGALTIVVPRRPGLGWFLGARSATVGLRCPDHAFVRRLCLDVGPLATTSANRHGEPPCTDARAVAAAFGDAVEVVDGGPCTGEPSTVVEVAANGHDVVCLRPGAVPWDDVLAHARRG